MTYIPPVNGGRINATIGGNTAGAGALVSTGTMFMAGGNNITLSQNANSITISAPNAVAQSNPGASASNGSFSFQTLNFSNANNVTFGTSAGGIISASVLAQSVETQALGMATSTAGGGTGGTSGSASGGQVTYNYYAGSNITLSQSINGAAGSLSIYGTSGAAQTVETQRLGMNSSTAGGGTGGTSGVASGGQLSYQFYAGSNVTLSQSINGQSGSLSIYGTSGAAQTVETQALGMATSTAGGGTAGTSGSATGGQIVYNYYAGSNVTLSQSVNGASGSMSIYGTSGAAQTVETQRLGMNSSTAGGGTGGTSGVASGGQLSYQFYAGSNVTLSQSINGASGSLSVYGPNAAGMTNLVLSANNTSTAASSYTFANSNGVSFSLGTGASAGSIIATVATNYQSQGAYLTTAMQSNAATISNINLSAGTASVNASAFTFANANGLAFGLGTGASSGSITASYTVPTQSVVPGIQSIQVSNTTYTTGNVIFSNANGLSFGSSAGGAVTASYTVPTQSVETQALGMATSTAGGGTAGTSGSATGGQIVYNYYAGSNITLSQSINGSAGSLSIYGTSGGGGGGVAIGDGVVTLTNGTAMFSDANNISFGLGVGASTSIMTGSVPATSSLSATGALQISTNGATISLGVLPDAGVSNRYYENVYGANNVITVANATQFSKRPYIMPFSLGHNLSQMRSIKWYLSRSAGTSLNMTAGLAIYSASNSTKLNLFASETFAISHSTSALWSGVREVNIGLTSISSLSLSAGDWWLGMYFNGSADNTAVQQFGLFGVNRGISAVSGSIFTGTNNSSGTSASNLFAPFAGLYSATTATNVAFPSAIGQSDLTGGAGAGISPLIYFQIVT